MKHLTPYDLFSPIHLAFLYRCDEKELDVSAADLHSIEAAQPEAISDPLFVDYRARADAGKLHKRRGRKPMSTLTYLRLWAAHFAIEEARAEIWARRAAGDRRVDREESPIFQAAEKAAREFRFGSGQSLLNRLSRLGIGKSNKGLRRSR